MVEVIAIVKMAITMTELEIEVIEMKVIEIIECG